MHAFGGGNAYAEVTSQRGGGLYYPHKTLAPYRYAPMDMELGPGMQPRIYEAIASAWKGEFRSLSGSVVDGATERQFRDALLVATTCPTLDAAAKAAGYLTVSMAPESTRDAAAGKAPAPPAQKPWLTSSFSLSLDGIDTSRVTRIESFAVSQGTLANRLGVTRDYQVEPGGSRCSARTCRRRC